MLYLGGRRKKIPYINLGEGLKKIFNNRVDIQNFPFSYLLLYFYFCKGNAGFLVTLHSKGKVKLPKRKENKLSLRWVDSY